MGKSTSAAVLTRCRETSNNVTGRNAVRPSRNPSAFDFQPAPSAVTISDPRGTINAIGLDLDNKAKTVKFKSHVSGQLQPQTTSR